jgi:CheY-like chemotaxis protein
LAISKKLVEHMGGSIGFHSEAGKGSEFWFMARFEKQPGAEQQRPENGLAGLRALVVEPNDSHRAAVAGYLRSWGIHVHEASDGGSGLRLASAVSPLHIVLTEPDLPDAGWPEFIQALQPQLASPQSVCLLYGRRESRPPAALLAGSTVDAYLIKPVSQSALFERLAGLINRTSEAKQRRHASQWSLPAVPRRPGGRVLLVEDNAVNQKVVLRILSKLGYAADAVANGLEAVDAIEHVPYNFILMDCQMPEMDGFEATAEIRRREGERGEGNRRHTPIIALTANAMKGDRERCLLAGMDDYLSKPIDPRRLAEALERWTAGAAESVCAEEPSPQQ